MQAVAHFQANKGITQVVLMEWCFHKSDMKKTLSKAAVRLCFKEVHASGYRVGAACVERNICYYCPQLLEILPREVQLLRVGPSDRVMQELAELLTPLPKRKVIRDRNSRI